MRHLSFRTLTIFAFWDLFFLIFRKLTANYKSEFDLLRAPAIALNVSVPDSLCVGEEGIEPSASASRTRRSTDDLLSVLLEESQAMLTLRCPESSVIPIHYIPMLHIYSLKHPFCFAVLIL